MNILYMNNSMHLGGDNKCIIKLCKELKTNHKVVIASSGGILEDELINMNIKHYKILDVGNKSPYVIYKNIKDLINIIKKEQIDIIHTHHRMSALTAKITSKFVKVKVVHTQHLCIEDKFRLTRIALKNIQTITVSNAAKRILVEKSKLDDRKINTIYNSIELEQKNLQVDNQLIDLKEKGYFIVAQIGRANLIKGVYDFIEVAQKMSLKNEGIKFVFIGDGPELVNMKQMVVDLKLQDTVYLLGSKDNILTQLKYIDLVILCSYTEGLPLVPLEAFSQSIPVIATNIDGTNEEIVDGYNGFLIEVKKTDEFVEKILEVYNQPALFNELKQNAKKMFLNNFDVKSYVDSHEKIYQELIRDMK